MILGLKKDMIHKHKVDPTDVTNLIRVIKEYIKCEILYVSNQDNDDIVASIKCLFSLSEEVFFDQLKARRATLKSK